MAAPALRWLQQRRKSTSAGSIGGSTATSTAPRGAAPSSPDAGSRGWLFGASGATGRDSGEQGMAGNQLTADGRNLLPCGAIRTTAALMHLGCQFDKCIGILAGRVSLSQLHAITVVIGKPQLIDGELPRFLDESQPGRKFG